MFVSSRPELNLCVHECVLLFVAVRARVCFLNLDVYAAST